MQRNSGERSVSETWDEAPNVIWNETPKVNSGLEDHNTHRLGVGAALVAFGALLGGNSLPAQQTGEFVDRRESDCVVKHPEQSDSVQLNYDLPQLRQRVAVDMEEAGENQLITPLRERPALRKVSITLSEKEFYDVQRIADEQCVTFSQAVRQCIGMFMYLQDQKEQGAEILLKTGRKTKEIVFANR